MLDKTSWKVLLAKARKGDAQTQIHGYGRNITDFTKAGTVMPKPYNKLSKSSK
jgi:hypothetical protein